jgi:aspartate kinase
MTGEKHGRAERALVTAKFGGTSMGTAESIRAVAEIVEKMGPGNCAVVVSATSGTTDSLLELGLLALEGEDWNEKFEAMVARHATLLADLEVEDLDLALFWDELRKLLQGIEMIGELSLSARDRLQTFGERVSSNILAALLRSRGGKSEALDAFNLVFTDNTFAAGNVDFERSNAAIQKLVGGLLADGIVPVITGFVAQSESGLYITLGRGGSDYTGAIVGAALGAEEVQIWTDVDGILNTDPRLVPEAQVLEQVSYSEASELAYFGAKVIHPKTIKPAVEADIPVRILNTFNTAAVGTVITGKEKESLKSVTYKKGISIINVCSAGMLEARGFMARLFEVFARHEVAVDVVSTSEVSVSMTVEGKVSADLLADLEKFASVEVSEGMAIVCLVGEGIRAETRVLGDLFSAIADHDVSMVSQGASKRNITFLVKEGEAADVVKKVFNVFFN